MFRAVMVTCATGVVAIFAHHAGHRSGARADLTLFDQGHINTIDPQQVSSSADMRLCYNLWEGLATHEPQSLQAISGMAEMPPEISPDGLVYRFTIRSDSAWSNGDPVTASDFVRGWRRALEPGSAGDYSTVLLDHVDGARQYYGWRNQAVNDLQQLAALAHGEEPAPDVLTALCERVVPPGAPIPDSPRAWAALRQNTLQRHAAGRPNAWAQVGIRAAGPRILEVRLLRPTPYFCDLVMLPVMMPIHKSIERLNLGEPEHGLDRNGLMIYDSQWTRPDFRERGYPGLITNGAYQPADWQFRRRLRLQRNQQHYFADRAKCRTIDLLMFEDANTAFLAYETGAIDWMVVLSVDYVDALLQRSAKGLRPDVRVAPAFGTYFYNLNCRDERLPDGRRNPFVDARVRRAFSLAVDRAALCNSVVLKANPPARTLIPPRTIPAYPEVQGLGYDPEAARKLLQSCGLADSAALPEVTIMYNTGFDHQRIAEAVGHMWEQNLGVRVRLQALEAKTFWADKAKHNFQVARGGWYGDYLDPTTFLDICTTGNGNNDSAFSDSEYDALLARAARTDDPQKRLALLAQAETRLVTETVPVIPLFQYTNPTAARSSVRGIHANSREIYHYRYVEVRP